MRRAFSIWVAVAVAVAVAAIRCDPQAPHAQVYIGERGRHVFKLVFHGESVSAAYDEGANAAVAAAQAVISRGTIPRLGPREPSRHVEAMHFTDLHVQARVRLAHNYMVREKAFKSSPPPSAG